MSIQRHKNNDNVKRFLYDVRNKCRENGIKLDLRDSREVFCNGVKCDGYFDDYNKLMVVSIRSSKALATLIHESCHLDQYAENDKTYKNLKLPKSFIPEWNHDPELLECNYVLDIWCQGKLLLTDRQIDIVIKRIMENERDCEIRSVKKIKKYKLQNLIDLDTYIRKANLYVLSIKLIGQLGYYLSNNISPFKIPEIVNTFSHRAIYKKSRMSKTQFNTLKKHCL